MQTTKTRLRNSGAPETVVLVAPIQPISLGAQRGLSASAVQTERECSALLGLAYEQVNNNKVHAETGHQWDACLWRNDAARAIHVDRALLCTQLMPPIVSVRLSVLLLLCQTACLVSRLHTMHADPRCKPPYEDEAR